MIITPNKFALLIEETVKTKRMSYMEAIIVVILFNNLFNLSSPSLIANNLSKN